MNVLITGNLSVVTNELCKNIMNDNKLVISGNVQEKYYLKKLSVYDYNVGEKEFEGIMKVFDFDKVIYFSNVLEGVKKTSNELENLENNLYSCIKSKVSDFIYVTTNDYEVTKSSCTGARNILLNTCEELCKDIASKNKINIAVLKIPYVCSKNGENTQLGKWIRSAYNNQYVEMAGAKEDFTDFVCDEDLGILINRIIDEPIEGYKILDVSGNNKTSFLGLSEMFKVYFPDAKIIYKKYNEAVPKYIKEDNLRKMYGWFSRNKVQDIIRECAKKQVKKENKYKKEKKDTHNRKRIIKKGIIIAVEMVLFFAVSQIIGKYTSDMQNINKIDFRLLVVMIFGITYGLYAGIGSAFLACICYVISEKSDINLQILFYDISNWIPFAIYFIAGTMSGYKRDKKEDRIASLKKRVKDIEEKYVFLNELYVNALDSKERFNKQIIGYNDSYGKIYEIIQKLNNARPEKVFDDSVKILESALGNKYVVIYTVNTKKNTARLEGCSSRVRKKMEKTLNLNEYNEMYQKLAANKNFVNNRGLKGYPSYANPIFRNGRLEGIIVIQKADMSMMNKEFTNKFNILTSFIKETMIRIFDNLEDKNKMDSRKTRFPNTEVEFSNIENLEKVLFIKEKKDGFCDRKNIYELFSGIGVNTTENAG